MLGLGCEGLFRVSPSVNALNIAIAAYDRGHPVDLRDYGPHVAASIIKQYMAMLPLPILPAHTYPLLTKFAAVPEDQRSEFVREMLFPRLDPCVVVFLSSVMSLLRGPPAQTSSLFLRPHLRVYTDICGLQT